MFLVEKSYFCVLCFCTLVRFMNVEYCFNLFKFYRFFFSVAKKKSPYVVLLWHTASGNKIYLFDLNFEKHQDQCLIGSLVQQKNKNKKTGAHFWDVKQIETKAYIHEETYLLPIKMSCLMQNILNIFDTFV